jgi:hypothetical protein
VSEGRADYPRRGAWKESVALAAKVGIATDRVESTESRCAQVKRAHAIGNRTLPMPRRSGLSAWPIYSLIAPVCYHRVNGRPAD